MMFTSDSGHNALMSVTLPVPWIAATSFLGFMSIACGGSQLADHPADAGSQTVAVDGGDLDAPSDASIQFIDSAFPFDGRHLPNPPMACGPDTCTSGCCNTQGDCVTGLDIHACGGAGNLCLDCAVQGEFCVAFPYGGGVCTKSAKCGPQNCPGCCQGDTCIATWTSNACGTNGEACVTCAAGDLCKGSCIHQQPTCDSTDCVGCCAGAGSFCTPGTADNACGIGGQLCQSCQPSQGQGQCAPQLDGGGICNSVQSCSPLNCSGCCDGKVCRPGNTLAQCGANGAVCVVCSAGQQCVAAAPQGGSCQSSPACTAGACVGCCQGNSCVNGGDDTICGNDGHVCQDCTAFGQICFQGACVDPYGCSPATCPGCCIGALCAVGNQDIACAVGPPGTVGLKCNNCAAHGLRCVSKACR
jgi:hypothetical protein